MFSSHSPHPGITSRSLGNLALSIGTSIAIETAAGMGTFPEEKPNTINHFPKYDSILVNLATLARNAFSCVQTDYKPELKAVDIEHVLQADCTALIEALNQHAPHLRRIELYDSQYQWLEKKAHGLVELRHPHTQKQKHQAQVCGQGVKQCLKWLKAKLKDDKSPIVLKEYNGLVEPEHASFKSLILTHEPADLVRWRKWQILHLLESHTGAIKPPELFWTKLLSVEQPIPFNGATLALFGDKELFKPAKLQVRQQILEIATKRQWTGLTTNDRFLLNLELAGNPFLLDSARALLRIL